MRSERFDFPGGGGERLAARLDRPDDDVRGFALFAHCFTCGKDLRAATRIAAALASRGIATLRFDFTGLGSSEGEFANSGFSANVADLVAAAAQLRGIDAAPTLLIGHSLGGAAVLAAAGQIPEARAVAVIGAPFEPAHVIKAFGASVAEVEARGEAEVQLGGRRFMIRRQFLDDVRAQDQAARIANLHRALLILHSPLDMIVGVEHARRIFDAARHPKSFVTLDDADHLLSRPADADYVAEVIAAWAARYLPPASVEPSRELPDEGVVLVEETGQGRFQQRIFAGGHRLVADEPVRVGGMGTGPTPYDLLAASLGACTAMTLRLYAEQKGWPLGLVQVRLQHAKVHAADCADCETRDGKIDVITRDIAFGGPLDADQRRRLLEIADKCPVHRTLHGEVKVRTQLIGTAAMVSSAVPVA